MHVHACMLCMTIEHNIHQLHVAIATQLTPLTTNIPITIYTLYIGTDDHDCLNKGVFN